MISVIDTTYSKRKQLPSFNEDDAKSIKNKGWSFSYVYNFTELRDVYLVLIDNEFKSLTSFTEFCLKTKLPFVRTKWNKRRILEHLNALKNFELVDNNYQPIIKVFENSKIGEPISDQDLSIFKEIYFTYFRFKEIFTWFINPTVKEREEYINKLTENDVLIKSKPVFTFSDISRFTDSFFYEIKPNPDIYFIDAKNNEDLMRFWDVFVKWGTALGILEKFNLRNLNVKTIDKKNVACVYVINKNIQDVNLLEYINKNYKGSYIYLPSLILDIAIEYRFTIDHIKQLIIDQYIVHKEFLSFERTSEIFVKKLDIKENDKIFFPKHNDSYVSHLIIRK